MIFALFGILITTVGIGPAFGDNESIIINIDKSSYLSGEIISISGQVQIPLGIGITLMMISPDGNIVSIAQMEVDSDNQFSTNITLGGPLMKNAGTYTIKVVQDENNHGLTSFEFGGVIDVTENELEQVIVEDVLEDLVEDLVEEDIVIVDSIVTTTTITVQDSTDLVSYEITNGKIINVIPDLDAVSLLVDIESIEDGSITLTIPRSVLDATINNVDDEFFVLVDGEEVDFEEITTSTDRTLTIEFLAGSEQIEIIGTFVIPEFGTIAAMILAVAIISIIAISAKSRLGIQSRY
jgi:predicted secreted protein with PEFG-CTERM motif